MEVGCRGEGCCLPLLLKNVKNAKNAFKIMKISTSYFYLASLLEEEFHGLCKAYNIKSELKYGRDLERR